MFKIFQDRVQNRTAKIRVKNISILLKFFMLIKEIEKIAHKMFVNDL